MVEREHIISVKGTPGLESEQVQVEQYTYVKSMLACAHAMNVLALYMNTRHGRWATLFNLGHDHPLNAVRLRIHPYRTYWEIVLFSLVCLGCCSHLGTTTNYAIYGKLVASNSRFMQERGPVVDEQLRGHHHEAKCVHTIGQGGNSPGPVRPHGRGQQTARLHGTGQHGEDIQHHTAVLSPP